MAQTPAPAGSNEGGLPYALAAYGIWGFVPLFFKLIASVPPVEVLAPGRADSGLRARLTAHVQSMRNHIQTLGAKSYQSQFEEAPDYVLMFVPGEHFIAAALERDPGLWDFAFERRVLLASPTNLVAIAPRLAATIRSLPAEPACPSPCNTRSIARSRSRKAASWPGPGRRRAALDAAVRRRFFRQPGRTEGQAGVPVQIQGVWVRPGDWLYADEDGIVVADRPL